MPHSNHTTIQQTPRRRARFRAIAHAAAGVGADTRIRARAGFPFQHRILAGYLSRFIAVLAIPLIMGLFLYRMTVDRLEGDYRDAALSLLAQTAEFCDRRFAEMDGIVNQIVGNPSIQVMKNSGDLFRYPNAYNVINTRKSLINIESTNRFLRNYFVLFNNSEFVLNDRITYSYRDFYSNYFHYEDVGFDEWYAGIKSGVYQNGVVGVSRAALARQLTGGGAASVMESCEVVTFLQPLVSSDARVGCVMFLIDNREISRMLSRTELSGGGFAFIVDGFGTPISYAADTAAFDPAVIPEVLSGIGGATAGGADGAGVVSGAGGIGGVGGASGANGAGGAPGRFMMDGREMLVSRVTSAYNGYHYVGVQPISAVHAKADYIKNTLVVYLFVSSLSGLLVSFYMARRSARPVAEIVRDIGSGTAQLRYDTEPFALIRTAFSRLATSNRSLTQAIDRQRPILRAALIGRLLRGEFSPGDGADQLLSVADVADIASASGWFCAVLFQYRGDILSLDGASPSESSAAPENNAFLRTVHETLAELFGPEALVCDIDEEKAALILHGGRNGGERADAADGRAWTEIRERVSALWERLAERTAHGVFVSVGGIADSLTDVSRSYEQARSALNFHIFRPGDTVLYYDGGDARAATYYFPQDIRNRLTSAIRSGDHDGVRKLLHGLFERNVMRMELPLSMQRMFLYDLLAFATQLAGQLSMISEEYQELSETLNRIEKVGDLARINLIYTLYVKLCEGVTARREWHKAGAIDGIESFVRRNFADPQLSLALVSEKFNISEAYLSHEFKQRTNVNFSTFVERLRMERAESLLANTDLPAREIARRTGYYATTTFCRAFKRVYSMNTGDYRRLYQQRAADGAPESKAPPTDSVGGANTVDGASVN
ncbi:MAG: helix-turn-helix domain-containing protein [Clostridiales bacterium]|jgi:AraC-like DNA-binding protein|nr:helix-turn-helix domain-containing protein [Clostridiales bacterium]